MKKLLFIISVASSIAVKAQSPFNDIVYLDVNKIKAPVSTHGELWWNPATSKAACEFPKGSGKLANSLGALWMSGYDGSGNLHISTQVFRQEGNDYWPGPLFSATALPYAVSQGWSKVWKVTASDINTFLSTTTHTVTNTPISILEWPAKNNPYAKGKAGVLLSITTDMAPFVDANGDGEYNPLQGDFPRMKGDEMLWWVFNDNGATHNNSKGSSLGMQIRATAYGYNRGTKVGNILFYEYLITNMSGIAYNNFRCALFNDAELGWYRDDYVGFDSVRRMGIAYNANSTDGSGQPEAYGASIPVTGVTILQTPSDVGNTYAPLANFMYYNNDNTLTGNPDSATQYNNYIRGMWRDGLILKNDFAGAGISSNGRTGSVNANYAYTGDPKIKTQWSECASANTPADRRFVLSASDYSFGIGATTKFAFALVITDTSSNNYCDSVSFDNVKELADTAWKYYYAPPPALTVSSTEPLQLTAYPNPVKDMLFVNSIIDIKNVLVYDVNGKKQNVSYNVSGKRTEINTIALPVGMYTLLISNGQDTYRSIFVKQ
ncbi:hypothetical protein CAP35_10995 [Chitinophagaceae bacterium IBVUCB1]|nr:hypothetical protein CAP35_10995 [Chitinophagaceae bacterium IBVUCB1]